MSSRTQISTVLNLQDHLPLENVAAESPISSDATMKIILQKLTMIEAQVYHLSALHDHIQYWCTLPDICDIESSLNPAACTFTPKGWDAVLTDLAEAVGQQQGSEATTVSTCAGVVPISEVAESDFE